MLSKIEIVGDNVVWSSDEQVITSDQATTLATNLVTLQQRAQNALTANDNFLAIAAPSNTQIVAQVQRLTKECNALIRLSLNLLSDVSDTA